VADTSHILAVSPVLDYAV